MKEQILFYIGTVFAYFASIVIVYFISAILPTNSNDTVGAGMEIGFRFFLYALLTIIAVCAGSFIVSKIAFSSLKPAALINGFILVFIFLLITAFVARG